MDTKSPALYSNKGKAEVLEDYGRKNGPERRNSNRRAKIPQNLIACIFCFFRSQRQNNCYLFWFNDRLNVKNHAPLNPWGKSDQLIFLLNFTKSASLRSDSFCEIYNFAILQLLHTLKIIFWFSISWIFFLGA